LNSGLFGLNLTPGPSPAKLERGASGIILQINFFKQNHIAKKKHFL
jgi:hypothetical protein